MDPHRLRRRLAADVELCRGSPVPQGATVRPDGINFAVASRYATSVMLLIFMPGKQKAMVEFPLDGRFHRTGEVWHAFLKGLDPGIPYAYRMDRVPNPAPHLQRFDPRRQLLDPYAKALTGGAVFERAYTRLVLRFLPERETTYGAETGTHQRAVVQTTLIVRKTNEQLPVDYRLIEQEQRWRVYDVVVDGISLAHNYRAQFDRIIRSSSYDTLVQKIKTRLAQASS